MLSGPPPLGVQEQEAKSEDRDTASDIDDVQEQEHPERREHADEGTPTKRGRGDCEDQISVSDQGGGLEGVDGHDDPASIVGVGIGRTKYT